MAEAAVRDKETKVEAEFLDMARPFQDAENQARLAEAGGNHRRAAASNALRRVRGLRRRRQAKLGLDELSAARLHRLIKERES